MDLILIVLWFLTALGFFFSLITSSYFVYVRGGTPFEILAKLIVALIVYGFLTIGTGFLAGLTLFIGANASPRGSILRARELIIGYVLLIVYAAFGRLMCSFIVGRLILPNSQDSGLNTT